MIKTRIISPPSSPLDNIMYYRKKEENPPRDYQEKCEALVEVLEKNGWFAGSYHEAYHFNTGNYGSLSTPAPAFIGESYFIHEEEREYELINLICEFFISPEGLSPCVENKEKRRKFLLDLYQGGIDLVGFTREFEINLAKIMRGKLNKIERPPPNEASNFSEPPPEKIERDTAAHKSCSTFQLSTNIETSPFDHSISIDEKFETFKSNYLSDYKCGLFTNPYSAMKKKLPRLNSFEEVNIFLRNHPNSRRTKRVLKKMADGQKLKD